MSTATETITETDLFDAEKEAYYRGEFDAYLEAQSRFDAGEYLDVEPDWPTEAEMDFWDGQFENGHYAF